MTVLLTGGYGFLGSNILKSLLEKNIDVIVLEKSFADDWRIKKLGIQDKFKIYLEDRVDLEDIFKENGIDCVIHTATDYGRNSSQIVLIENNVIFPLKLLSLLKAYNGKAFLNTDSYFNKEKFNLDYLGNYILTKKQLEQWLKNERDIRIFNLKLEHIYGNNDSLEKFTYKMINDLFHNKFSVELTSGEQKRDFIYVLDVVNLYITIILKIEEFEKSYYDIEVGTGNSISIKEFVETIKILTRSKTYLDFGKIETRKNEIIDSKADLNKIKNIIEWKPKYTLEMGLKDIIKDL